MGIFDDMFKTYSNLTLLIGSLFFLNSCHQKPWEHNQDMVSENQLGFIHFSDSVLGLDSLHLFEKLVEIQHHYPAIFSSPDTSFNWKSEIIPYLLDPEVQALYQDARKFRMPINNFESKINYGISQYNYRFRDHAKKFDIYTYISRNENFWVLKGPDIYFLPWDRYLGRDHPLYARESNYQRSRHDSDQIIIELFRALSEEHISKSENNSSLLTAMINSGKKILFVQTILGEDEAYQAMNISLDKYDFLENNEKNLWTIILNQRWLFNKSFELKRKLIEPSPFSPFGTPIDHEIPGQVGVWFGWRILQSFWLANPELTLSQILDNENVNLILQKSGYRP
tara:strand:- start:15094 stop:16110 length:1017 start_codon:yes stop_codon:yes gene_type:complete